VTVQNLHLVAAEPVRFRPGPNDSSAEFRTDINGLRAVAVLAVTLFHLGVPCFDGGFVGVDIFFVISGFLMTGIMTEQLRRSQFRFSQFIWSRLLRIYPPMLAMLAVAIVYGFFFLTPVEYITLSRGALASVLSSANILFYTDASDYFALAQKSNWLLHLWSLGAEVQFYLLLPIILLLAKGRPRQFVAAIFLCSLVACVLLTPEHRSAAFYLLPTRVWEFLAGSLAFLLKDFISGRAAKYVAGVGLIIVLTCIACFRETIQFPGLAAIAPVLGTALVVASPSNPWLLRNRAAQFFGTISYSLYIWHWPIWVIAQQYRVEATVGSVLALFTIATALGATSYYLIERFCSRIKTGTQKKHGSFTIDLTAVSGLVAVSAAFIIFSAGLPKRIPDLISGVVVPRFVEEISYKTGNGACFLTLGQGPDEFKEKCFDPPTPVAPTKTIFIWGDSYAAHLWFGFAASSAYKDARLTGAAGAGCEPILETIQAFNGKCVEINRRALHEIIRLRPDFVVLFARWPYGIEVGINVSDEIKRTIETLNREGIKSVVVGPVPEWFPSLPQRLLQASFLRGGSIPQLMHDKAQESGRELDRKLAAAGAGYVSIYDLWCTATDCRTMLKSKDRNELTVYDFGHMTVPTAEDIVTSSRVFAR
jgi:peptidoglycan/LPS O-acetylase OafA/YrhL